MRINRLKLTNFKNHELVEYFFDERFICITGVNGIGKTNILDSIYYQTMTRSYFNHSDRYSIQHGKDFFRIEGEFILDSGEKESCVIKNPRSGKKEVIVSGAKQEKFSQHIGRWPVVFITPGDHRLLMYEGSKERQKFLDLCLSQIDSVYISQLQKVQKILKERNAFLKQLDGSMNQSQEILLRALDRQMVNPSDYIYKKRKEFIEFLNSQFMNLYGRLSGEKEKMDLTYRSHLEEDLMELLEESTHKELALGYTTRGVHRDDLVIKMNNRVLRNYGSQGQIKSMVIALKLAQLRYMLKHKDQSPIVLLDDLFEKLDSKRLNNLVGILMELKDSQVFITDTSGKRISSLLERHNIKYDHILLKEKPNTDEGE